MVAQPAAWAEDLKLQADGPGNIRAVAAGKPRAESVSGIMIQSRAIQNDPLDKVRNVSIPDEDLQGAVVLAKNILHLSELCHELTDIIEEHKRITTELRRELDEQRRFNHEMMTRLELIEAARKHHTIELPSWFWRVESEDHFRMLKRRADYLRALKIPLDDAWDLSMEFATDYCHLQDVDDLLTRALEPVYKERSS